MNKTNYLKAFRQIATALKNDLRSEDLLAAAVTYGESFVLKIYKSSWSNIFTNPLTDPLTAETRIFFSIWVNEQAGIEQKLFYNIHALKLRHLRGYKIESRKFAAQFREYFKLVKYEWPNVSVDFGPLTLMEGWVIPDPEGFQQQVTDLAKKFIKIAPLIDQTLAQFRR